MARQESPKEDLMRDATALVERVEFSLSSGDIVVCGFRSRDTSDGTASFFFGEEPVYQFNAVYELRRCHLDGIIKAERGGLVRLRKVRTGDRVEMQRHEFTTAELDAFLGDLQSRLRTLLGAISDGDAKVLRSIPNGDSVAERVKTWLSKVATASELRVATRPNVVDRSVDPG